MDATITMTAQSGTEGRIEGGFAAAMTGMEALTAAIQRRVEQLNTMSDEELKATGLGQLQHDLGKAMTVALVEKGRAADALRKERGGDGIDLGAARLEIGRALARIADRGAEG